MKLIKKKIIATILAMSLMVMTIIALAGCFSSDTPALGRYYLGDSNKIFIEILEDYKITFNNVDFTQIEYELLQNLGVDINLAEKLENTFNVNEAGTRIFVDVMGIYIDGFGLSFHFDYSARDRTLTFGDGQVFIRR